MGSHEKSFVVRSSGSHLPAGSFTGQINPSRVSYGTPGYATVRSTTGVDGLSTPKAARILAAPQSAPPTGFRPAHEVYGRYELEQMKRAAQNVDKSKGLRHFSTKVCEKVKEKKRTNYNEVADELVAEYFNSQSVQLNDEKHQYDMKNIRRRVYDALNVLLAMNIIVKNKKEIQWVGLPTSTAQEFKLLEEDKIRRTERIREKADNLQEMIVQLVAYKSLVERNREKERMDGRPPDQTILYLPYVIVNTEKRATVECNVSDNRSEIMFNFDQPFEIHDDVEVLKRLGLGQGLERGDLSDEAKERVKNYLPPILRGYVDQIMDGTLGHQEEPPRAAYVIQQQPQLQAMDVDIKPNLVKLNSQHQRLGQMPTRMIVRSAGDDLAHHTGPPRYTIVHKPMSSMSQQSHIYQPRNVMSGTSGSHQRVYAAQPHTQYMVADDAYENGLVDDNGQYYAVDEEDDDIYEDDEQV